MEKSLNEQEFKEILEFIQAKYLVEGYYYPKNYISKDTIARERMLTHHAIFEEYKKWKQSI